MCQLKKFDFFVFNDTLCRRDYLSHKRGLNIQIILVKAVYKNFESK